MKSTRILLVEDSVADIELVREALDATGLPYVIDVANDFDKASSYIASIAMGNGCPDIILMDLNLPQGSGLDLLRMVRDNPHCGNIPAIVVSSSNAPRDRAQAALLGAAHYFRKPTDFDEFMKLGPLVVQSLPPPA